MVTKPSDFFQPRLIEKLKTVVEVDYTIAVALLNFAGNLGFILENHEIFEDPTPEHLDDQIDIKMCRLKYIMLVQSILALTPQEIVEKLKDDVPHLHSSVLGMYEKVDVITKSLKK